MTDIDLAELTADLVGAYVGSNAVPMAELPDLISSVHGALARLAGAAPADSHPEVTPAVNPKKSVFPDYLISLEDGNRYTMLRRHLNTLGMTPQQYREKWRLPADYPMTCANYSAKRSALAKSIGLGRKSRQSRQAPPRQA